MGARLSLWKENRGESKKIVDKMVWGFGKSRSEAVSLLARIE